MLLKSKRALAREGKAPVLPAKLLHRSNNRMLFMCFVSFTCGILTDDARHAVKQVKWVER